jgi:hypothetical protein
MKKKKQYTGEVPFDYFGELVDREYNFHRSIQLTPDNFVNGLLRLNHYDHTQCRWVLKDVTNPPADFEITYLDPSDPLYKTKGVVATIPTTLRIPNYEFDDKLEYQTCNRGSYSVGFSFKSVNTNKIYPMFMKDFDEIVSKMNCGILEGRFTFCKRGPSYAIVMI